ncbi:protein far-red impaired response 1 [Phtheirospermum japonicum]|uniref:Protein FAR1-RELATED SEQUENCE n=1 Tax=Phtheirospermum japonicum TaxID=374723 RepID=A0A830BE17_9LAMI|nr:protein far-red impaired response 1 [Phtheirospermum japonicum]
MDSESPEEFEARWTEKTSVPELERNKWLLDIYSIRRQWVSAFVRQFFTTGMLSSQRVESNHSLLKRYL